LSIDCECRLQIPSENAPRRPSLNEGFRGAVRSLDPSLLRRVVVENVLPQVDGGRFPSSGPPAKR
jgi:hypothetical protein